MLIATGAVAATVAVTALIVLNIVTTILPLSSSTATEHYQLLVTILLLERIRWEEREGGEEDINIIIIRKWLIGDSS